MAHPSLEMIVACLPTGMIFVDAEIRSSDLIHSDPNQSEREQQFVARPDGSS